jgi:hypothetical protein
VGQTPAVLNEPLLKMMLQFLLELIVEGKISREDGDLNMGLGGPADQ